MGDEVAAFLSASNGRFAAIHGDYRLDNLLIGPDRQVIAVDWQTLAVGRPGRDLAYFIATSMPAETRRVSERSIIEAYQSALCAGGVDDCSLDDCVDEYVCGLVHPLFIIVVGCAMSEATERGDRMFTAMTERVAAAIDDHGRLRR
jgi:thiamine kinase-like enzyme